MLLKLKITPCLSTISHRFKFRTHYSTRTKRNSGEEGSRLSLRLSLSQPRMTLQNPRSTCTRFFSRIQIKRQFKTASGLNLTEGIASLALSSIVNTRLGKSYKVCTIGIILIRCFPLDMASSSEECPFEVQTAFRRISSKCLANIRVRQRLLNV